MFISDFAIRRPVITVVSMLALVVFGLFALFLLQTDEFPDVACRSWSVAVPYPGASPDSVEREIVDPLEEAISGISGVKKVTSNALDGFADDPRRVRLREGPAGSDAGDPRRDQRDPQRPAAGDGGAGPHAVRPDRLPDRLAGALVAERCPSPQLTLLADPGITRRAAGDSAASARSTSPARTRAR